MAVRPTTLLPQWATTEFQEVVTIDGSLTLVTNKVEPTSEFQNTGVLARQALPRPYLNWTLDELCKWVSYLANNSSEIGDYKVMPTATTATDMEERFGGTWTDHGTSTLAGQTIRLFERAA